MNNLLYFAIAPSCMATFRQTMVHSLTVSEVYLSVENKIVMLFLEVLMA